MSHVAWTCLAAAFRRTALPLASYYAVTLAAPLANGAARSGATFVEHALVVVVVPPIAIVLTCSVLAIGRAGLHSLSRYSARRAAAGSIRAARLLGSHAAIADAPKTALRPPRPQSQDAPRDQQDGRGPVQRNARRKRRDANPLRCCVSSTWEALSKPGIEPRTELRLRHARLDAADHR